MERRTLGILIFIGALCVAGVASQVNKQADPPTTQAVSAPAAKPEETKPADQAAAKPTAPAPTTAPAKTEPAPAAPAPKPEPTWQAVKTWEGTGIVNTETFAMSTREWRINWQTTNEQVAGILQVFVYDQNGGLVSLPVNHQGVGKNISYVRASPGKFYLTINSANVKYKVTVEELR
ncbi:MAG TPA: hypothetical protein VK464_27785 [Symbiobacteriaceae bacterium]|nr:hypothetical protein [Symbiobacteriaceae bacterium]